MISLIDKTGVLLSIESSSLFTDNIFTFNTSSVIYSDPTNSANDLFDSKIWNYLELDSSS